MIFRERARDEIKAARKSQKLEPLSEEVLTDRADVEAEKFLAENKKTAQEMLKEHISIASVVYTSYGQ